METSYRIVSYNWNGRAPDTLGVALPAARGGDGDTPRLGQFPVLVGHQEEGAHASPARPACSWSTEGRQQGGPAGSELRVGPGRRQRPLGVCLRLPAPRVPLLRQPQPPPPVIPTARFSPCLHSSLFIILTPQVVQVSDRSVSP